MSYEVEKIIGATLFCLNKEGKPLRIDLPNISKTKIIENSFDNCIHIYLYPEIGIDNSIFKVTGDANKERKED